MMIKVSNEFLDFDDDIEVEKQIKLFEDISTTDGDFSYAFDIPKTLHNTRLLQNPFPDNISKPVYQQIPAKLLGDSGAELYDGYLRVERVTNVYSCSFFAGNNNWFAMITGLLSDLDLSRFDVEQTTANIEASWLLDEGLVFPLVDNGALLTRSYKQLKIEDFVGAFYVKTIFNQIFVEAGIKIQGELLNDWMYNNIICEKNSKDQAEINARTSYAHTTFTARPVEFSAGGIYKTLFPDDTTFPYFDGDQDNWDVINSRYVADVKMIVRVESSMSTAPTGGPLYNITMIYVNGVEVARAGSNFDQLLTINKLIPLDGGDYIEIWTYYSNFGLGFPNNDITDGMVRITPTYIYKTLGRSAVPNWTKQQFVSNILKMFNVLASYNEGNATLTLNLFEKIKDKTPVDLSEYISEVEVDYSEFISDYGNNSKLSYNEVEFEELKSYNTSKYFKYSQGAIEINNDFLEDNKDILQSDFSNPIAYINGIFDMSMERTNLIELEEDGEIKVDFTAVTNDGSGGARFAIPDDIFFVGDLVRVTDSIDPVYNGEWVVDAIAAGTVDLHGLPFNTNTTGTITKLTFTYANSDDVYLFINIPNYAIFRFSGVTGGFDFEIGAIGSPAVGYFDLINTGKQINLDFIYSLSFGGIDDPLHYQITMIEQYFRLFSRVLNDPVKLFCTCHIPYALFVQIDFLSPIIIRTLETTNTYYLNRISGYKESYRPVVVELIKIP